MPIPDHDLTPEKAIEKMEGELASMREENNRAQLTDISSDVAFELGYETAIHDFKRFTGPSTIEVGIITYTNEEPS